MHRVSRETGRYRNAPLCGGSKSRGGGRQGAARRQFRALAADPHGQRWQRITVPNTSRHPGPSSAHWMRPRSGSTRGAKMPIVAMPGPIVLMASTEQSAAFLSIRAQCHPEPRPIREPESTPELDAARSRPSSGPYRESQPGRSQSPVNIRIQNLGQPRSESPGDTRSQSPAQTREWSGRERESNARQPSDARPGPESDARAGQESGLKPEPEHCWVCHVFHVKHSNAQNAHRTGVRPSPHHVRRTSELRHQGGSGTHELVIRTAEPDRFT